MRRAIRSGMVNNMGGMVDYEMRLNQKLIPRFFISSASLAEMGRQEQCF